MPHTLSLITTRIGDDAVLNLCRDGLLACPSIIKFKVYGTSLGNEGLDFDHFTRTDALFRQLR
jgi:hypothetical protein